MLFRKLLELQYIGDINGVTNNDTLKAAFNLVNAGKFKDSIKVANLEKAIKDAYINLAGKRKEELNERAQEVFEKATLFASSEQIRKEKSDALEAALNSNKSTTQKIDDVSKIFLAEYEDKNIRKTFGDINRRSSPETKSRHRKSMATEIVRLIERTNNGEPALTQDEQTVYFSIVQQIAKGLAPSTDIMDVQLKSNTPATGKRRDKNTRC